MSIVIIGILALVVALLTQLRALKDQSFYRSRIEALRQKNADLENMLTRRGILANEVAHEIKNPITAILCSAESLDLMLADKIDPSHRQLLRYIKEYGDNLLRLVSDFLDVSMAESGKIEVRPEYVPVVPLVESIIGLLQSNAIKKHINVTYKVEASDLAVRADSKHVKQILFNLLHNAIKFTNRRGQVEVQVSSSPNSPFLKFVVADNGPGLSADAQANIFDLYANHDVNGTRENGAGLGLALCRSLVQLNGGTIQVQSNPGVGTAFIFYLPVGVREPCTLDNLHEVDASTPALCQPLLGLNFLVVDEDLGSRASISSLIEAWGGLVDQVAQATDAVSALASKSYDAVMIDNSPDGIVGYELARMIRNDQKARNTTIILASRDPIDLQLAKEAGADKTIEKPLNGKVLLSSLLSPRDLM